jgi:Zn-dependent protease with chaperone function
MFLLKNRFRTAALGAIVAPLALASAASAQRTELRPGWNMFSPQQDIQVGRQAAEGAERQLPMCNDPRVDAYLTKIGMKLVAHLNTEGVKYPWEFHCVNDKAINAFALPGGFVFINRGVIEAADDEAQLAAVMAHELSHVALRHGTNQATKAQFAQVGVGLLGALLGGSNTGALLTELGSFTAGGVLLRYSRSAETQADVMGTQVLYDSGYDPRALAQFFEKLQADSQGKNPPEFFSDHPSPDHRVERVDEEIEKLGGVPHDAKTNSREFEEIKREVLALPVVKKGVPEAGRGTFHKPEAPSAKFADFQGTGYTMGYPSNWEVHAGNNSSAIGPEGGFATDSSGTSALAYGMTVGVAKYDGDTKAANALQEATKEFIRELQQGNPKMKVTREPGKVLLNDRPGLSTYLSNDSPMGGQETDWLITVLRPEGLVYFVCTAPQGEFSSYDKTFGAILDSVRFNK